MANQGKYSRSGILKVVAVGLAVVTLTGAQKSCKVEQRVDQGSGSVEQTVEADDSAGSSDESSVVVYSVTSDARIKSVTYLNTNGKKVTRTDVGRSWSGNGPADHGTVLISATTGDGSSMIKCSVKVRGKVVQRASAVGGGSTTVVCQTSY